MIDPANALKRLPRHSHPMSIQAGPCTLQITVIDTDPDYLLLRVSANDGYFAGTVPAYEGWNVFDELRDCFKDFPRGPTDTRELILGSFGPKTTGGAARLHLYCTSRAGHVELAVTFEDATVGAVTRTGIVLLRPEPVALDRFLATLPKGRPEVGLTTILIGAG